MSDATPVPPAKTIAALRDLLCRWYDAERRDLPWRRTRDPYAVWISEAMLQQTRVEAVLDHYHRFLTRFPDVAALAASTVEEVEAAWSGLGYYRRARALREAARVIVAEHDGALPADREAMLALPGVGRYTAGAVLSIAFGHAEPLVDGNVARVFSRLFLLEDPLGSGPMERRLWAFAAALVPPVADEGVVHPSHWNQGLMELGARVCAPRDPRCLVCPLTEFCAARRAGRVAELPVRRPRRAAVDVALEILVVRRGDGILIRRRPAEGRMAGLWELPTREVSGPGQPVRLWPLRHAPPVVRVGAALGTLTHSITHHRIRAVVRAGEIAGGEACEAPDLRWVRAGDAADLALTGMARKALRRFVDQ